MYIQMYIQMYNRIMKSLSVTEFRQQCLQLLDHIPPDGVVITRRGRPVARIVRERGSCSELIGSAPDVIFDNDDDLFSTGVRWDAES
jgi:antitoxin (DNA-binding transcriptional repressor) of toxin-antitoxin stability system